MFYAGTGQLQKEVYVQPTDISISLKLILRLQSKHDKLLSIVLVKPRSRVI